MIMPELLALLTGRGPSAPSRTPQDLQQDLQRASEACARAGGSDMDRMMCILAGLAGVSVGGGGNVSVPDDVRRAAEEYAREWQRLRDMCASHSDPIKKLACILEGMQRGSGRSGRNAEPGVPEDKELRMLRLLGVENRSRGY